MSAGRGSRLDDVRVGSIHKLEGRILVCTGIWWDNAGAEKVIFYEPSTDKENECSESEVAKMVELGKLVLHTPNKGRVIR